MFLIASELLELLQKAMYWVLNSLVILVVGFGATNLAADVTNATSKVVSPHGQLLPFVSSAFAQNDSSEAAQSIAGPGQDQATSSSLSDSQSNESLNEQLTRQKAENDRLKKQLESTDKIRAAKPEPIGDRPRKSGVWKNPTP